VFGPRYFAPSFFPPGGGGSAPPAESPRYWAPRYWAARYWGARYFPGLEVAEAGTGRGLFRSTAARIGPDPYRSTAEPA
jgi:hypothetical protein